MNTYTFASTSLCACGRSMAALASSLTLTVAAFAPSAVAAEATVLGNTVFPTSGGMWLMAPTGRFSYCVQLQNTNGAPLSRCSPIGTVGLSSNGHQVIQVGGSIFAINRTTGAIHSCTVALLGGTNPAGGCSQVSAIAALQ